jgi:hypothetical protein
MPQRAPPKPVRSSTEEHKRARRIFARLMGGESMRAIAASENLSLRRVQQIVREQLDRRNANPADDFAFLQIARLERALDLIGSQIDAGKPAAAHAFVRLLDHLNRLAPDRLRLRAMIQRVGDEVDNMEDRLGRLDAAREALALRQAKTAEKTPFENPAKRKRPQALDIKRNDEMADSAPPMISEA